MSGFHDSASGSQPYKDPTPLPDSVPRVQELGVTSAPLKSAAFFIGAYCKEYNGVLESNYMGRDIDEMRIARGFYALQE
jgi:hypothetical protein